MTDMLTAAVDYAYRKIPVFPLHYPLAAGGCSCKKNGCDAVGKHPLGELVPHGVKDATTNLTIVNSWWGQYPEANIGIPTGSPSGLIVLDFDFRNRGEAAIAVLEEKYPELKKTAIAKTGNGFHYYLRGSSGIFRNSSGLIASGVDVRGEGGYVVTPPSMHWTGSRYIWLQREAKGE